jgi:hypothetical protein
MKIDVYLCGIRWVVVHRYTVRRSHRPRCARENVVPYYSIVVRTLGRVMLLNSIVLSIERLQLTPRVAILYRGLCVSPC